MTSHRKRDHNLLETLCNKRHKQAQFVVENAFGILKKTFHKLQGKIEMHISFVFDFITCCWLLHNLLISCHEIDVEQILTVLNEEATIATKETVATQEGVIAIEDGETFSEQ